MAGEEEFRSFSDRLRLHSSPSSTALPSLLLGDSIWSDRRSNDITDAWKNVPSSAYAAANNNNQETSGWYKKSSNGGGNGMKKKMNKSSTVSNSVDDQKKPVGVGGKKKKSNSNSNNSNGVDKRFKTLPATEALSRSEDIGGYIFVCNNETMEENLQRRLFGLPARYRDSVRAIRPGLPLFLYNYSSHQLHGIFQAASFGGTNIDPTAWVDKEGESRFPAQVRAAVRKACEPLEEDAFRPVLHHYDGPKFRLELSVPEAIALLDMFASRSSTC